MELLIAIGALSLLGALANIVGSDGVTGACAPRLNASAATLAAIVLVVRCVLLGSGAACTHRSGLPSRLDSAAHRWSRRAMLRTRRPWFMPGTSVANSRRLV